MTLPLFASVVGGLIAGRQLTLRRHDRARFLATVSHELRTPLNAIMGWMNLLKSGTLPAADALRALDSIERNVRLEALLVDQLLDASQLAGKRTHLVLAPTDVRSAISTAVERVSAAARSKGVQVRLNIAPSRALVSGDEPRLTDAFWHLLSNAVKFTPGGGRVQVDVETRGDRVCVRVADDGEGIAPDDLPHVFEPFLQGRTRAKRAGLGLGLLVARELVRLHGGTISAHSAGRGQGAVFSVRLPAVSSLSDSRETKER